MFFWLQLGNETHKCHTAVTITGTITIIAFSHYVCIFHFGVEAFSLVGDRDGGYSASSTGATFNDAYQYVSWFITVPLLLIELSLRAS
jgi:bacteriorhodopsin